MTIEVATYINDLQPVNPTSTDQVSQGDDHLRLIKQVLQNTFLNATRAFSVPSTYSYSTSQSLVKANGEGVIYCATTGGAVTFTLPSLVALDAGWKCDFVKTTSDNNPMFIKPVAGTINSGGVGSLAQARRCIPGVRVSAVWDGTNWFMTRALALPIASIITYWGTTLPAGFEWPSGQTLSSAANYPEYNAVRGSLGTPDLRGLTEVTLDNLGGTAAGHWPNGLIAQNTLGAIGGVDAVALSAAQLAPHTHGYSGVTGVENQQHTHNYTAPFSGPGTGTTPNYFNSSATTTTTGVENQNHNHSYSGNTDTGAGVAGAIHSNLQPSVMCGKILVVE